MSNQLFKNWPIDGPAFCDDDWGMESETAEQIATRAFGFLAADKARMTRFLTLTGLTPDALASLAGERTFLAGVLDHLMSDDALILTFCANADLRPEDVQQAHRRLVGVAGAGDRAT